VISVLSRFPIAPDLDPPDRGPAIFCTRNTAAEAIASGFPMRPIGNHRLEPLLHRFRVLAKSTSEYRCLDGAGVDHIRADSFACQVRRPGVGSLFHETLGGSQSDTDATSGDDSDFSL
jgi:hypothetical protein